MTTYCSTAPPPARIGIGPPPLPGGTGDHGPVALLRQRRRRVRADADRAGTDRRHLRQRPARGSHHLNQRQRLLPAGAGAVVSTAVGGGWFAAATADGHLYVDSADGYSTGSWSIPTGAGPQLALSGGVAVSAAAHNIYATNVTTGQMRWIGHTPTGVADSN